MMQRDPNPDAAFTPSFVRLPPLLASSHRAVFPPVLHVLHGPAPAFSAVTLLRASRHPPVVSRRGRGKV
jgi:hypothetical protein